MGESQKEEWRKFIGIVGSKKDTRCWGTKETVGPTSYCKRGNPNCKYRGPMLPYTRDGYTVGGREYTCKKRH